MAEATTQEATEYSGITDVNAGQVADTGSDYQYAGDETGETDFSSSDYDTEARKFQSMYDREVAKNKEMGKYEPLIELVESRPDLVQTLQTAIVGGQPATAQQKKISEDEFSPWKAFFDPRSESYQHVQKEMQKAVNRGVQQQMGAVKEQVFMNDLKRDLKENYNFNDNMVDDFVQFYSTPKEDLPFEALVDVYLKTNGSEERSKPSSSLDIVRANKQSPRSAGIVQGQAPRPKSERDQVWDGIMNASTARRLP